MATLPPQPRMQTDIWQKVLRAFLWLVRIPVCLFILFTTVCLSVIGFVLVYWLTVALIRYINHIRYFGFF